MNHSLIRSVISHLFIGLAAFGLTGISSANPNKRAPVAGPALRFIYREYDDGAKVVCKHNLVGSSPYDWAVKCFRGEKPFAEYTAHVALSEYSAQARYSIELLYWLSGSRLPAEVGSTTWFHFSSKSAFLGLSSSQLIERGTAGLYLEIDGAGFRRALK